VTAIHAALLALAAIAAVACPLATYTLTLAAFGLVHVLAELRFVALRFGPRLASDLRRALIGLVVLVAAGRLARRLDVVDGFTADILELLAGIALVVVVVPTLARVGRSRVALACAVGIALAIGVAFSPVHALLVMAVLHNLTPVGFLAEATQGAARRRTLVIAGVVFVAVPLAIASGLPFALAHELGLSAPELAALPAGPLHAHMRAYLPAEWLAAPWALHAFSACVFLQCAHYVAVIDVLPRTLPTPRPRALVVVVTGLVALAVFALFVADFADARRSYGVIAAVHAWIEVPLLLLATALPRPREL
jgi:hypothetical protein